jgi:hypothetical protein
MKQARAHRRAAGIGAFALLALVAEVVGRSLTVRLNVGGHVPTPSYAGADYYPLLLAFVKGGVAVLLAALTWRFVRARAAARTGRRLLAALGGRPLDAPRMRVELSLRTWALAFGLTAGLFLVQTDSERWSAGDWPLVYPWLHTSALSVFAVLSVLIAVLYRAVARWLEAYERYAEATAAAARRLVERVRSAAAWHDRTEHAPPRRLHGLAFECRPPPATA